MPTQTNSVSMTQSGNMIALVAFLGLVLSKYGVNVSAADLTTIIAGLAVLGGIVTSFVGRYRHGDISLLGVKTTGDDSRGNS
jgi:hypothetical protein